MKEPGIIYEDDDFLAVDKPAGLLVHPIRNKPSGAADTAAGAERVSHGASAIKNKIANEFTLVGWLLARYPKIKNVGDDPALRPGIVHRLDKDTSGVMLVAKNQKAFDYLKALFMERGIEKEYLAIVRGKCKEKRGVIDAPLGIVSGSTKRSTRSEKMAKPAVTEYRTIRIFQKDGGEFSLLEVYPKTGRTHQIRAHLASIGHPIVGDALYGGRMKTPWATRLMLHAKALQFTDPRGVRLRLESPAPEIFGLRIAHP